jgi:YD repeat-containing protein
MNDNYIRNREGRIIGRFDGQWLRDEHGKLVAKHDASDDRTRTREGKIVGNGDLRLFQLGKDQPDK